MLFHFVIHQLHLFIEFPLTTAHHSDIAQEMIPEQQRQENHMRFGLAICSHALNGVGAGAGVRDDDLFFVAVNQINRGGPGVLGDPNRKVMMAALNMKAGKRSIELSDFSSALKLYEHG